MAIVNQSACKEVELTFASSSASASIAASGKTPAAVMAAGQAMGGQGTNGLPFVPDTKPASRARTLSPEEEAKLLEDSKWNPELAADLKARAENAVVPLPQKQVQELYKEVWQFLRNLWRRVTHLDDDKRDELQAEEKLWMSEMEPLLKKINFTSVHRDNFRIRFQEILTQTRANLNQRPKNPLKAAVQAGAAGGILGGSVNGSAPLAPGRIASPMQPGRVSTPPQAVGIAPPPPAPYPGAPHSPHPASSPFQHTPVHRSPMAHSHGMPSPAVLPHSPMPHGKRPAPSPSSSISLAGSGKRARLDSASIGSSPWDGEATLCLICDLVDMVDAPSAADQDRMYPEVLTFVRTAPPARIAQTVRPLTQQLSKFRPEQQADIADSLALKGFSLTPTERPTIHSVSTSSRSSLLQSSPQKKPDTPWNSSPTVVKKVPLHHSVAPQVAPPPPMMNIHHAAGTPGSAANRLAPSPGDLSRGTSMAEFYAQRRM